MISSVSTTHNVSHTKEVLDVHRVNKVIEVEKLHVERDVVTTHLIHREQINYVYNVQNRTVYQPVNQLGSVLSVTA